MVYEYSFLHSEQSSLPTNRSNAEDPLLQFRTGEIASDALPEFCLTEANPIQQQLSQRLGALVNPRPRLGQQLGGLGLAGLGNLQRNGGLPRVVQAPQAPVDGAVRRVPAEEVQTGLVGGLREVAPGSGCSGPARELDNGARFYTYNNGDFAIVDRHGRTTAARIDNRTYIAQATPNRWMVLGVGQEPVQQESGSIVRDDNGVRFQRPLQVHLLGRFAINNFGGLGGWNGDGAGGPHNIDQRINELFIRGLELMEQRDRQRNGPIPNR